MSFVIVVAGGYEFASMADEDGEAINDFVDYMRHNGKHMAVRLDWENYEHLVWIDHIRYWLQTMYMDEPCMLNSPEIG